jgi:hypothetical protein
MIRQVPISRGLFALVDDVDYESISKHVWTAQGTRRAGMFYAARYEGKKYIYMHRAILGLKSGQLCDHINGDGLDNRRENIRKCDTRQNNQNSRKPISGKTSIYKGVSYDKASRKYYACIRVDGKSKRLGLYSSEIDAAKAYDAAAKKYFGEFARLNFKKEALPTMPPHEYEEAVKALESKGAAYLESKPTP